MRETPLPAWFGSGLLIAGHWEPLAFRRRAGFARIDEAGIYAREHHPDTLARLRARGVNLVITHFHKGFGLEEERPEIERAAALVRDAHGLGLRVGAYIRFDAVAHETYLAEVPEAAGWFQQPAGGVVPTYPGQDFRRLVCPSHDAYVDRVEALVRLALGEIGFDLLHLDGFTWGSAVPCHCPRCVEGFRAFLAARYPDAALRRERFGHTRLERMEPPLAAPASVGPLRDPVHQEWVDYRCERFAAIHARLARAARAVRPEAAVTFNTLVPTEWNGPQRHGVSLPLLAPRNDAFWTESGNDPRLEPDGRLICRAREYKYAEALENVCFSYVRGPDRAQVRRSFAEVLAFNAGHGGMVGSPLLDEEPFAEEVARWCAFYRRHQDLYTGTESAAEVAVLRHQRTLTLDGGEPYRSAHLLEQLLLEAAVPFRLLVGACPRPLDPGLRLLVLPEVDCLEEEEASAVAAFVQDGGGLVVTGDTSLFDRWHRRRPDYLLREVIGPAPPVPRAALRSYHESVLGQVDDRPQAVPGLVFSTYGRGRAVYAARVLPAGDDGLWRAPAGATAWLAALRWAAGALSVEVAAPRGVLAEARRPRGGRGYRVHLVNLAPHPWSNAVAVRVRVEAGGEARSGQAGGRWQARLLSPDHDPRPLPVHPGDAVGGSWDVVVPELETYALLAIEPLA